MKNSINPQLLSIIRKFKKKKPRKPLTEKEKIIISMPLLGAAEKVVLNKNTIKAMKEQALPQSRFPLVNEIIRI